MKVAHVEFDDGTVKRYELSEEEVTDLTSAALYGNGWLRLRHGEETTLINLGHVLIVEVMPCE